MPTVTIEPVTRPEDLVDLLGSIIDGADLGFRYIAKYDEELIPAYPCVQIQPGELQREVHGTHQFQLTLRAFIYVMHAKLTVDRQRRSREDCELATAVVALLHNQPVGNNGRNVLSLGGKVIAGMIDSETPANLPPRTQKGDAVVGTRLSWSGIQIENFK